MKNLLIIIICLFITSSCVVVPKNITKAKKKIERKKEQINKIAKYHGLDSVWYVKRKLDLTLPEVKSRPIIIDFIVNKKTILDSIIVKYSKDTLVNNKISKKILDELVTQDIEYQDSLLFLTIRIRPESYNIDYKLKERKVFPEIEYEQVFIETSLKFYQHTEFWIITIILSFITLYLVYLLVKRKPT